jgi:hypothetical protein
MHDFGTEVLQSHVFKQKGAFQGTVEGILVLFERFTQTFVDATLGVDIADLPGAFSTVSTQPGGWAIKEAGAARSLRVRMAALFRLNLKRASCLWPWAVQPSVGNKHHLWHFSSLSCRDTIEKASAFH